MISISLDKLLLQKQKKEQLAKGDAQVVTTVAAPEAALAKPAVSKVKKATKKSATAVSTTLDVDQKLESLHKEPAVQTGILVNSVQEAKSTEMPPPAKKSTTGIVVSADKLAPKLDSKVDPLSADKKAAAEIDRSKYRITSQSPKRIFEHYLSGLNNVPDYNRQNLLAAIRNIVSVDDFNAMMAAHALDDLEPIYYDSIKQFSPAVESTNAGIVIMSPIDTSFAFLISQLQSTFRSQRQVFISEEADPVRTAIDSLGIRDLAMRDMSPLTYVVDPQFKADTKYADLIYLNTRFAMPQLYSALFYSISALKASKAGSTKHILVSTLTDLGESLSLKDLVGNVTQDTFFDIVFGSKKDDYTDVALSEIYHDLTNSELRSVSGGVIETAKNPGNHIQNLIDSMLNLTKTTATTTLTYRGAMYKRTRSRVSDWSVLREDLGKTPDNLVRVKYVALVSSTKVGSSTGYVIDFGPVDPDGDWETFGSVPISSDRLDIDQYTHAVDDTTGPKPKRNYDVNKIQVFTLAQNEVPPARPLPKEDPDLTKEAISTLEKEKLAAEERIRLAREAADRIDQEAKNQVRTAEATLASTPIPTYTPSGVTFHDITTLKDYIAAYENQLDKDKEEHTRLEELLKALPTTPKKGTLPATGTLGEAALTSKDRKKIVARVTALTTSIDAAEAELTRGRAELADYEQKFEDDKVARATIKAARDPLEEARQEILDAAEIEKTKLELEAQDAEDLAAEKERLRVETEKALADLEIKNAGIDTKMAEIKAQAQKEKDKVDASGAVVTVDKNEIVSDALIQLGDNAEAATALRAEYKQASDIVRNEVAFTSMKRIGTAKQPHAPIVYLYDLII